MLKIHIKMNINLIVFLTNGKIYKALVEIEQNIKNVIFYEKKIITTVLIINSNSDDID